MYFTGPFIHVMCTCMFFMFLMILGLLMKNSSELPPERSDQLTDQHSELTF